LEFFTDAVFFNSYCGFDNEEITRGKKRKGRGDNETYEDVEKDKRCTSIREAVKFAKSNNLLGVIFDATLLVSVFLLRICLAFPDFYSKIITLLNSVFNYSIR
jgi:hypothetical protein